MKRVSDNNSKLKSTNLQLVHKQALKENSSVVSIAVKPVTEEKLKYNTQITLILLDFLNIMAITAVMSLWSTIPSHHLYIFNISLFVCLAVAMRLYDLEDSRYCFGKILFLGAALIIPQIILMPFALISINTAVVSFCVNTLLLLLLCWQHHVLSYPFSKANKKSLFFKTEKLLKRFLDIVLAVSALILALPCLISTALLIWLEDRGPIIFTQERIGLSENIFFMYKLRTMKVNADKTLLNSQLIDATHPVSNKLELYKRKNDPRITFFGKLLRKLSIDEMPQLVNVLKGEMSIVGPRPPLVYEYKQMTKRHRQKFKVVPGITGLWQVTGRVKNERNFDKVANYDIKYIENWCLLHDLEIVLRTIPVVIFQKGAC